MPDWRCISRAIAVWLLMMLAETCHGILRTLYLAPLVGDFRARQICTFTGAAILLAIAYWFHDWIGANTRKQQLTIGVLWLIWTVCFEILLGVFVAGLSWYEVTADFRIWQGGLLPIGLVALALSLRISNWLHRRRRLVS